ncbi:MAG: hypothetical protein ACPHY8_01850 [Patescibacteria group bacterium]
MAQKVQSEREVLDQESNTAFESITRQCKLDLSSFKFDMINEKF